MKTSMTPLKTAMLLIMLVLFVQSGFSQKYKIKDDIIYLNKVEVGKVEGEATFKSALLIKGTNSEEVLSIKIDQFNVANPFLSNVYWYDVRFHDTGKTLALYYRGNCGSKCILNNILADKGIIIDGSFIKNQDEIISQHDVSEKINKDTTATFQKHKQMITLLEANKILRSFDKPVMLIKDSESSSGLITTTIFSIAQDNTVVGRIIKTRKENSAEIHEEFHVFEKLYEPDGDIKEVPACKVTSMFMNLEFYTVIDNKKHEIVVNDRTKGIDVPKVLANYLVAKGYL